MTENGPFGTPFLNPEDPPEKVYVGSPFLRSFPGNEAHKLFFVGGPNWGVLGGAKKFTLKKIMCFFRPLPFESKLSPTLESCYSWECIFQIYRYRYCLEIRMKSFNYHYRSRLGICSHPLFSMGSQLPERTEIAAIFAICDCDAHRGPQKSRDFRNKRKQCRIAIWGCDGKSLAICDFGLRFLSPKTLLSAGILAIWLSQRGNR